MPRRLVLVLIALLLSGGTFFLAQQWLHAQMSSNGARGATGAAGGQPPVRVLVAKTDLPAGALLTADSLRFQTWPSDDPSTPYLVEGKARPQDFVGAVVRARLTAGQPLTPDAIVKPGDRGFMAAVLTPGSRAISINVTPNTGMAGFLMPGDHVDVILTLSLAPREKDGPTRHVSETVLRDLRVVGVDQTLSDEKKADKKDPVVPKTATLEVTPKQAEIISVAADLGVLSLTLHSLGRPPSDNIDPSAEPTRTWDNEAAKGILSGPPSDRPRRPSGPVQPLPRLIVVRGDSVSEIPLAPHVLNGASNR